MGALLQVPHRLSRILSCADRNSFPQKIVDFVVQDRNSGAIVALIEVYDYSHNAARDAERDAMKARAGFTTIRIPGRPKPTLANVRQALAPLLPRKALQARSQLRIGRRAVLETYRAQ